MTGITDPSQEYFKDGLWAWVSTAWKKLVADASSFLQVNVAAQDIDVEITQQAAADLTPGIMGWDGSAWHKLALLFGYSDRYAEQGTDIDVAAGNHDLDLSAVPEGEIWVVSTIVGMCSTANPYQLTLNANMGGIIVPVYLKVGIVAWLPHVYNGQLVLKEGDFLRSTWTACVLNDDLYIKACGYKMKIAE